MKISRRIVFGLSFGALASVTVACNPSVIYHRGEFDSMPSSDPSLQPQSQGQVPNRGTGAPAASALQSGMSFVLDPEKSLSKDDAITTLFPDSGIDAVDMRTALEENEYTFDMQFRVEKTSEATNPGRAYLDGKLLLKLVGQTKKDLLLEQSFEPDGDILLTNSGDLDKMTATLRDTNNDGVVVSIEASRVHSETSSDAQKNSWRGVVKKVSAGKEQTLGRLTGFFLPIDDKSSDLPSGSVPVSSR